LAKRVEKIQEAFSHVSFLHSFLALVGVAKCCLELRKKIRKQPGTHIYTHTHISVYTHTHICEETVVNNKSLLVQDFNKEETHWGSSSSLSNLFFA